MEIQLNASKEEVEKHNQKLISLNEKIVKVKSDNYSLDDLETKKSTLETSLTDLLSQRDTTQSKIGELEREIPGTSRAAGQEMVKGTGQFSRGKTAQAMWTTGGKSGSFRDPRQQSVSLRAREIGRAHV